MGRTVKQTIYELAKLIQLWLSTCAETSSSVFRWSSSYIITVTKSCFIQIYSSESKSNFFFKRVKIKLLLRV